MVGKNWVFPYIARKKLRVSALHHGMGVLQFNHSPFEGHLDCFCILAITKQRAAIIVVYRFLCEHTFSFLWDKYPRMQFLGHITCFVLQEIAKLFSRVAVSFTSLQQCVWSSFSVSSPALGLSLLFILATLIGVQWYIPLRLKFAFP